MDASGTWENAHDRTLFFAVKYPKEGVFMGQKEESMIAYYNNPEHFADLMNGWIYRGEKQLTAAQIQEMDTRYTARTGKNYRTRYRDIAKRVKNVRIVLIVGTEIQTYVDYSMPVRGMDYDAIEYKRQISEIKRMQKSTKPVSVNMSPMSKTDRLIPAVTLVLYMGEEPWDAADNLYEILDFSDVTDEWKKYIQNYKVHVLDIGHTPDERLMEFPDDIACMFLSIKYAKDKKNLAELAKKLPQFMEMGKDTYETVWNYIGNQQMLEIKKAWETEGGKVNMRCAIDEIYEDGIAEGEKRGEKRGEERGISCMLELLKEFGCTEDNARFHLEMKFHLSEKEADVYMKKYWGI